MGNLHRNDNTMIGFIATPETSAAVTQAIRDAQTSRNLPVFWLLVGMPIYFGDNVGMHFIPADDDILSTPLRGNPIQTPQDFPEFSALIAILGGLDARVSIDSSLVTNPLEP
jgi:hypothetical protein